LRTGASALARDGAWTRERRIPRLSRLRRAPTRAPRWALPRSPHLADALPWKSPVHAALARACASTGCRGACGEVVLVMRADVMTPTRRDLLMLVRDAPGSSTRSLARRVGLDESTAAYHLGRLSKLGLIVEERAGNVLAHYSAGWGDARARAYATLSTEARVALAVLKDLGRARAAEVARWSGMPLPVARHALLLAERRHLVGRAGKQGFFEVVE